jgi:ubiquitin-conjugating enzyme E2 M
MRTSFPDPNDILNFTLTIEPDEGMYKGGSFHFSFAINQNFPHDPPKVKCTQKIYHPNIDLEGNVCLNILREDWKPVLNLNAVIVGLQVRCLWGGHGNTVLYVLRGFWMIYGVDGC